MPRKLNLRGIDGPGVLVNDEIGEPASANTRGMLHRTSLTIEEGDLSDWKSRDFERRSVFVKNERDKVYDDWLQDEHDRARDVCVKILPQMTTRSNVIC
jgi:hypothetical protein